jgi:ribonuclease P protein component
MKVRSSPQGFPKDCRLLRRAQFKRVYDEGQRRSASICTIFFRSNGLPQTRVGVTAPVRLGNAVFRNRLKRRLREVFRLHRAAIPGGWDVVLNPRQAVAKVEFKVLEREILKLFPPAPPPEITGKAVPQ